MVPSETTLHCAAVTRSEQADSGALQAVSEGNVGIVETLKAGRPSKFKPELIAKLMAVIADGLTSSKRACLSALAKPPFTASAKNTLNLSDN